MIKSEFFEKFQKNAEIWIFRNLRVKFNAMYVNWRNFCCFLKKFFFFSFRNSAYFFPIFWISQILNFAREIVCKVRSSFFIFQHKALYGLWAWPWQFESLETRPLYGDFWSRSCADSEGEDEVEEGGEVWTGQNWGESHYWFIGKCFWRSDNVK